MLLKYNFCFQIILHSHNSSLVSYSFPTHYYHFCVPQTAISSNYCLLFIPQFLPHSLSWLRTMSESFPPLLQCSKATIISDLYCCSCLLPYFSIFILSYNPILLSLYSNQNNLKAQNQIMLLVLNPSVASHCKGNQPNVASPATNTGVLPAELFCTVRPSPLFPMPVHSLFTG